MKQPLFSTSYAPRDGESTLDEIESVNDQLKNICQIEHSRHRSCWNFLVNLIAGLIAYTYQPKLPSLDLQPKGLPALPPAIF